MTERHIKTTEDGTAYSDKITVMYRDMEETENIIFYFEPDSLYGKIRALIEKVSNGGADKNDKLSSLIKVGVKGILLMYGGQVLDRMFGSKDHPKPGKGDDLLDWYTDIFTRITLSQLMKADTILTGKTVRDDELSTTIEITAISTRSLSATDSQETSGKEGNNVIS